MAEKVLMTALSPTMEEGTIVRWNKQEGDKVAAGDLLCEVETDKATMDYEATQEGTLLKIVRSEGSASKVGETIAILGEEGEDIDGLLAGDRKPVSAESARAPVAEPKPAGAPRPEGARTPQPEAATAADRPAEPAPAGHDASRIKASPLARKLAAERGIDLAAVSGSGPAGRVVKADIEGFTPEPAAPAVHAEIGSAGQNVTIPVAGKRAVIARRLAESKFSAPHYYLKSSVRMGAVMEARRDLNAQIP
jgi:pyruvate dehydrogenase E2 component (dihydrolipoamide acetyltransferase)